MFVYFCSQFKKARFLNIIDKYTPLLLNDLDKLPAEKGPENLYEPCRYILQSGGKRLRPVFTLVAAGICGEEPERAIPAALSVELIHNFTLVHDDIMDQADARRGIASVHKKWDMPTAILSGDMLYVEAFKQLLRYGEDDATDKQRLSLLFQTLLTAIQLVCEGQALDISFEKKKRVSTDQYLQMIEGKTSALISCSLVLGGIVAGADNDETDLLQQLGTAIGLAFQVQDDLLDVVADPEKFGKVRGGDIREGKKTFPLLIALERCNEMERKELHRLMDNDRMSESDVKKVIQLFNETDAIKYTSEKVHSYYNQSFDLLNQFVDSEFKRDLTDLINFLKNRDF